MLTQQKIKNIENQRKLMEDSIRRNVELELKQREIEKKIIEDKKLAEVRGKSALVKEKQFVNEISNNENTRRMVERKQKVKEFETQLSHSIAQDFRDKEAERQQQESMQQKLEQNTSIYAYNKNGAKIDSFSSINGPIDYTNTCFHNALIVKHDSLESSSEVKSKLSKSAFDQAEDFKSNLEKSRVDKLEQKRLNDIRAQRRGQEALEKLNTKPFDIKKKTVYQAIDRDQLKKNTKQRKLESELEKAMNLDKQLTKKTSLKTGKKEKTQKLIKNN